MTTALAPVNKNEFAALDPQNALAVAMTEHLALTGESIGPKDLVRVKTPAAGGTQWQIQAAGGDKPEYAEAIEGILVYYHKQGVLWPSDDALKGTLPVLRTFDLQTAEQVGPIPDAMIDAMEKCRIDERTFKWTTLPWNEWGTGKGGVGKRCKEQRVLYVLRQGDMFPLIITAQPGSLNSVTDFIKRLFESSHKKFGEAVPYYRCVVRLSLKQETAKNGQVYAQIVPSLVACIDADAGAEVKAKYTDVLQHVSRQVDVQADDEHDE
jgi:hypothetical protein